MGMYGSDPQVQTTSTTNTYDAESNARAMDVLERQQEMSEDQWALAKTIFEPYEREMVAINRELLPEAAETSGLQLGETRRDIVKGREVKDALREAQIHELGLSTPAMERFYEEATEGVDVGERMGLATSDVASAFKGAEGSIRRSAGRMGMKVTAQDIRDMAIEEAKAKGFARTSARVGAENENFNRLGLVMQARGRSTGLPGTQVSTGANETQYGGYGLRNPTDRAMAGMEGAGRGYTNLANRVMSSTGTTTQTGGGSGAGDFLATAGGLALGAYTGGMGTGLAIKHLAGNEEKGEGLTG